jgi:hypothetical protein
MEDYIEMDAATTWEIAPSSTEFRNNVGIPWVCRRCLDSAIRQEQMAMPSALHLSQERTAPLEHVSGKHAEVPPSSPFDFNFAPYDPDLPTLDMDAKIFQDDAGDGWAFQSRMPTPPPAEVDAELQKQLKDIGNKFQSLHDADFFETDTTALSLGFSNAGAGYSPAADAPPLLETDLFESGRRRLLI